MAYSDFTLPKLTADFGVTFTGAKLFTAPPEVPPSAWLLESLALAEEMGYSSEKSRSERLVNPVLAELTRRNPATFAVLSGAYLDIEPQRGLNGECDFILTFNLIQDVVSSPIFCIAEAKKQDIEQGSAQCAAQLLGAAALNERENNSSPILYGCATTGLDWRFIRLEGKRFEFDTRLYSIYKPAELLGVLQWVLDRAKKLHLPAPR